MKHLAFKLLILNSSLLFGMDDSIWLLGMNQLHVNGRAIKVHTESFTAPEQLNYNYFSLAKEYAICANAGQNKLFCINRTKNCSKPNSEDLVQTTSPIVQASFNCDASLSYALDREGTVYYSKPIEPYPDAFTKLISFKTVYMTPHLSEPQKYAWTDGEVVAVSDVEKKDDYVEKEIIRSSGIKISIDSIKDIQTLRYYDKDIVAFYSAAIDPIEKVSPAAVIFFDTRLLHTHEARRMEPVHYIYSVSFSKKAKTPLMAFNPEKHLSALSVNHQIQLADLRMLSCQPVISLPIGQEYQELFFVGSTLIAVSDTYLHVYNTTDNVLKTYVIEPGSKAKWHPQAQQLTLTKDDVVTVYDFAQ